jgi:hypothetical protein
VNDTSPKFFGNSHGLRQGDPLSLLLFVIVIEALSKRLSTIVNGGFLLSFSVGSWNIGALNIFHLLFVDDTLIFYGAIPVHLLYLHALLLSFEAVFNLKINMAESELVCVGNVNNVDGLASILGCEFSSLPLKYLGLTLGAFFKAKSIWNSVIEKIKCHLASWKMMYLSKVEGLP